MPRSARLWHYGLLGGAFALLGLFLIYPIFLTLTGAFYKDQATRSGFTLDNFVLVFQDPRSLRALSLYPIIYLNATAALANLDPALNEAAENLGAGPVRRFFRITLPLVRPGLFAGATIVFIWSFTELGTPLMFDYYEVTPIQ